MTRLGRPADKKHLSRPRRLLVLPAALVGFAIWLVAPALSLGPYVPEPVDFELADQAPQAPVRDSSREGGAFRSHVLSTPKRFNLVGLRWKGARAAKLRVRVRLAG